MDVSFCVNVVSYYKWSSMFSEFVSVGQATYAKLASKQCGLSNENWQYVYYSTRNLMLAIQA